MERIPVARAIARARRLACWLAASLAVLLLGLWVLGCRYYSSVGLDTEELEDGRVLCRYYRVRWPGNGAIWIGGGAHFRPLTARPFQAFDPASSMFRVSVRLPEERSLWNRLGFWWITAPDSDPCDRSTGPRLVGGFWVGVPGWLPVVVLVIFPARRWLQWKKISSAVSLRRLKTSPEVSMRYNLGLLMCLAIGCGGKPLDREQGLKKLKEQADEVGRATLTPDHARMADLSYPALVKAMGGRQQYMKRLDTIAAEMKGEGFTLTGFKCGEPSDLVQASGEVYAVVPYELEMIQPDGSKRRHPSYLIGVSADGGQKWSFIDGAGIGEDRDKLKQILPKFPKALPLPPR